jgi:hypothetical protein
MASGRTAPSSSGWSGAVEPAAKVRETSAMFSLLVA